MTKFTSLSKYSRYANISPKYLRTFSLQLFFLTIVFGFLLPGASVFSNISPLLLPYYLLIPNYHPNLNFLPGIPK